MLKHKVINAALHKVLADKNLTFGYAIRLAAMEQGEKQDDYSVHYIRFLDSLGNNTLSAAGTDYAWLHNNFLSFLHREKLLEPEALPALTSGYKPDEFDFSDWDSIKKSIGF